MKYVLIAVALLFVAGCGSSKKLMRDCNHIKAGVFECEDL